jgi:hypothetical protein
MLLFLYERGSILYDSPGYLSKEERRNILELYDKGYVFIVPFEWEYYPKNWCVRVSDIGREFIEDGLTDELMNS